MMMHITCFTTDNDAHHLFRYCWNESKILPKVAGCRHVCFYLVIQTPCFPLGMMHDLSSAQNNLKLPAYGVTRPLAPLVLDQAPDIRIPSTSPPQKRHAATQTSYIPRAPANLRGERGAEQGIYFFFFLGLLSRGKGRTDLDEVRIRTAR